MSIILGTEHFMPTGLEHCLSSMDSLDRFSSPHRNLEINCINNHVCPRDSLSNRLNELMPNDTEIMVEQRQDLLGLLQELTHIFNERPELNQIYMCRYIVQDSPSAFCQTIRGTKVTPKDAGLGGC